MNRTLPKPTFEAGQFVRVVCSLRSAFHDRFGRSRVADFSYRSDAGGVQSWRAAEVYTARTELRQAEWSKAASVEGAEPNDAGEYPRAEDAPEWPFPGSEVNSGVRPSPVAYLHGDELADDPSRVEQALVFGERWGANGAMRARSEELDGRANVELSCKCGQSLRVNGEQLWPALDAVRQARQLTIELSTLRRLLRELGARGM